MKESTKDALLPAIIVGGVIFGMFGFPMLVYNTFWMIEYNTCIKSGGDPVSCAKELKMGAH